MIQSVEAGRRQRCAFGAAAHRRQGPGRRLVPRGRGHARPRTVTVVVDVVALDQKAERPSPARPDRGRQRRRRRRGRRPRRPRVRVHRAGGRPRQPGTGPLPPARAELLEEVTWPSPWPRDGATSPRLAPSCPLAEVTDGGPSAVEVGSPLVEQGRHVRRGRWPWASALAAVLAVVLVGYRGKSHSQQADLRLPRRGAARSRRAASEAGPAAASRTRPSRSPSTFVKGDFETRLAQRLAAAGLDADSGGVGPAPRRGRLRRRSGRARARRRACSWSSCSLPASSLRGSTSSSSAAVDSGPSGAASGDAVTHRGRPLGGPVDAAGRRHRGA